MKYSNFLKISFCLILVACASNNQRLIYYHPAIPPEKYQTVFNAHFEKCKAQAYANIPLPSHSGTAYRPTPRSAVPDLVGSIMQGYESARNSPSAVYERAIRRYTIACIKSKGWVIEYAR